MNTLMLLQMAAEALGERAAVTVGGETLSYVQLQHAVLRAGALIRDSGAERVSLLGAGGLAVPVTLFGAAAAGLPYAPLNYRLTQREIDALLGRLAPALLIADEESLSRVAGVSGIEVLGSAALLQRCREAGASVDGSEALERDPETVAVQLFTSGTTGTPKAALLRHRNLVAYVLGSVEFASADAADATLVSVPPYHIAGIAAFLSSVYAGRHIVLLPAFEPAAWLAACAQHRVSNAFVVPTMLARIVEYLRVTGVACVDLPALRAIAYGGGRMPPGVIEAALALFPQVGFTNAYGLTETSSTITVLGPEEHRAALASTDAVTRRRLLSVGRPLPGVEIRIRDAQGRALGRGQPGEIHVRGEQVAGEYAGIGSLLDAEGFFPTRDAGYLDEAGYLFLDGRVDDVIVRGGENISPGEVEEVLREHPAVQDAAAVAMPSDQWGEAVAAAVVLRAGASVTPTDLQELVRTRLRSSRVPEHIAFVPELPYNEMGKLLRRELRDIFAARSG